MNENDLKIISNNCIIEAAHDQLAVTCTVSTAERGGVSKLLGITSECRVYAVEAMKGEAKITGKVSYKVIYLDKDGKPMGLDYFCDFNETIADENITASLKLTATSSVVDVSGTIEGNDITLTSVCDFVLRGIISREGRAIEPRCGIFARRENQQCVRLSALKETAFELSQEEESGASVDKILLFETSALVTDVEKTEEGATVNGIAVAEIVYLTESGIRGKTVKIDFSNDIEALGKVDVRASVKSSRLVLSGEETNNIFEIELYISLSGYDVSVEEVETVVDVFCLDTELKTQSEYLPCKRFDFSFSVDSPISAEAEARGIDSDGKVLASPVSRVNIAKVVAGENRATIEGIAVATVLFSDQNNDINAAQVELPFSLQVDAEGVMASDFLTADALATGLMAGFAEGSLRLSAQLSVTIYVFRTYRLRWLSAMEEGEKKARSAAGISVCFANPSESVWEVAKAVNASPDDILKLNPAFEEGNAEASRITIFRHRED